MTRPSSVVPGLCETNSTRLSSLSTRRNESRRMMELLRARRHCSSSAFLHAEHIGMAMDVLAAHLQPLPIGAVWW